MTILSKIETLVEYAKMGMEFCKFISGKSVLNLELPRSIPFLSNGYSPLIPYIESVSSKHPLLLGNQLFAYQKNIKSVKLSETTDIPVSTFYNCSNLSSVELPNTTDINDSAFNRCTSLTEVNLPNVTYVGNHIIAYSGVKKITFPKLKELTGRCFGLASELTEVYCESVETIKSTIFDQSPNVKICMVGRLKNCEYGLSVCPDLEYFGVAEGTTASISLYKNTKVTQECLHSIIENYANMSDFPAPTFLIGEENIKKIDVEHIIILEEKNINYQ